MASGVGILVPDWVGQCSCCSSPPKICPFVWSTVRSWPSSCSPLHTSLPSVVLWLYLPSLKGPATKFCGQLELSSDLQDLHLLSYSCIDSILKIVSCVGLLFYFYCHSFILNQDRHWLQRPLTSSSIPHLCTHPGGFLQASKASDII